MKDKQTVYADLDKYAAYCLLVKILLNKKQIIFLMISAVPQNIYLERIPLTVFSVRLETI